MKKGGALFACAASGLAGAAAWALAAGRTALGAVALFALLAAAALWPGERGRKGPPAEEP